MYVSIPGHMVDVSDFRCYTYVHIYFPYIDDCMDNQTCLWTSYECPDRFLEIQESLQMTTKTSTEYPGKYSDVSSYLGIYLDGCLQVAQVSGCMDMQTDSQMHLDICKVSRIKSWHLDRYMDVCQRSTHMSVCTLFWCPWDSGCMSQWCPEMCLDTFKVSRCPYKCLNICRVYKFVPG